MLMATNYLLSDIESIFFAIFLERNNIPIIVKTDEIPLAMIAPDKFLKKNPRITDVNSSITNNVILFSVFIVLIFKVINKFVRIKRGASSKPYHSFYL